MESNGTCFVCGAKAYMQHSMDPVKYFIHVRFVADMSIMCNLQN